MTTFFYLRHVNSLHTNTDLWSIPVSIARLAPAAKEVGRKLADGGEHSEDVVESDERIMVKGDCEVEKDVRC